MYIYVYIYYIVYIYIFRYPSPFDLHNMYISMGFPLEHWRDLVTLGQAARIASRFRPPDRSLCPCPWPTVRGPGASWVQQGHMGTEWTNIIRLWIVFVNVNKYVYIYIYINRYSTFKCVKFMFIPKQLNTNVIRWPVIRWQLLPYDDNFYHRGHYRLILLKPHHSKRL